MPASAPAGLGAWTDERRSDMRIPGVERIDRAVGRLGRLTPGRLARALAYLGTRSEAELEGLVPGLADDLGGDWRAALLRLAVRLARRRRA
jgi:hypothetical protein